MTAIAVLMLLLIAGAQAMQENPAEWEWNPDLDEAIPDTTPTGVGMGPQPRRGTRDFVFGPSSAVGRGRPGPQRYPNHARAAGNRLNGLQCPGSTRPLRCKRPNSPNKF